MNQSPFAWLVVTPLVTAPLSALLLFTFGDALDATALGLPLWRNESIPASVYYFDFWPTLLLLTTPGLLNLLVVLWFFQPNGYVRVAAGLALVLALVRTFGVLLFYFWISQSDLISHEGGLLMRLEVEGTGLFAGGGRPPLDAAKFRLLATMWLYGSIVWAATLAMWGLYNLVMDRFLPDFKPPHRRRPGEPRSWGGVFDRR